MKLHSIATTSSVTLLLVNYASFVDGRIGRSLSNGPPHHFCATDVKKCDNGAYASRDPKNGCKFEECPSLGCGADVKKCDDGSYVSRDPKNECKFEECPSLGCAADVKECGDGSYVSRDPKNGCQFEECPSLGCAADVKECSDGSYVSRDPRNGCKFEECPSSIIIQYPVCTDVEGFDDTCLSCCLDTFKSYRDDKCGLNMGCHDLNVPSWLVCEAKCVATCEHQCVNQHNACVKSCERNNIPSDGRNDCYADCNHNWWDCSGTCKKEQHDMRENLNDSEVTDLTNFVRLTDPTGMIEPKSLP